MRAFLPLSAASALKLPAGEVSELRAGIRGRKMDRIKQYLVPFAYRVIGAACLLFATATGLWAHSTPPVITSVTPNPITVGTINVTITGTGFTSSDLVYDSYGSNSMIQYAPSSVTSTSITVTGIYQGPASTSTFCVGASSSNCSNSIVVPVGTASSSGGSSSSSSSGGSSSGSSSSGSSGSGSGSSSSSGSSSAPVITSVLPNPVPVGTENVTITGSGFQTGAMAYQTYGTNSMIQYNATVGSGSVTVNGIYQGPASTVSFEVCNPGRVCSNAITVPVSSSSSGSSSGGSATTYTLTVVNGTLAGGATSGSYTSGTSVTITANPAPAGEVFQDWTGAQVTNPQSLTTTLNMPSSNTTVTASYDTPVPVPQPVTTHPRLWITQADLPRLQSWATESNPIYVAELNVLARAVGDYSACFPGAQMTDKNPTPAGSGQFANVPYPDLGDTQGYQGILTEEDAMILAFHSLIDPSSSNRIAYAQAARNMLMYAFNLAALGHLAAAPGQPAVPFRDPEFATFNRANLAGHEWALAVDWIYSAVDANQNPILTSADKAVIQNVFMQWANDSYGSLGLDPQPLGVTNNLALVTPGPNRWASNNYYLGHARNMTMMALAIDPVDDPPVNAQLPASNIGNTLRSYILDANGAWLYQIYAMMGDPATVAAAYNLPNNPTGAGFGLSSGGLPPEGFLYGESMGFVLADLLALQTSGFNNPEISGPQIGLIGAPIWDRYVTGFISSLTPAAQVNPTATYYGPVYQFAGYGDMLREYVTPDFMRPMALLALLEQENGSTQHLNAARWFVTNAPTGGEGTLISRVSQPWTWGAADGLLAFLLFDPSAPTPTDPRPAYPTLFYDAPAARIVAHSDWTPNGTMFDYKASWESINHQDATGGQFEFYRKGEWLTKEMSNYDNNGQGLTTLYHNTLALQNTCINIQGTPPSAANYNAPQYPCNVQWNEPTEVTNGSQFMWGASAGDPTTITSSGPGYVYAASDLTKMYNRPSDAQDAMMHVTQATRSIVWLDNDYIVTYDRATTDQSGLFKIYNLSLVTEPQIAGNTATETMPDGQHLFIQTLLPASPTLSSFNGAANLNPIAELEPTQFIYQVQDASNPMDTRFLHVLQGADSGTPMALASYLQSSGATDFDGAAFGSFAVFFPQSATAAFGGATFTLPTGVHTLLVTGLTPNAGYSVIVQANAGGDIVTVNANGSSMADNAGVLMATF